MSIYAQDMKTVRLEVPADLNVESYHVESLNENGVLVFYESNELSKENKRKWYFGSFNTDLNQNWLKFVELENKMKFVKSSIAKNKIHLLFRNIGKGRNEDGFYQIISLDFTKHKFEEISGTFPAKAEIVDFKTLNKTACLGINIKKGKTDLLFIDLPTGNINPISLAENSESLIETIFANKYDGNFYVVLKVKHDNRYIQDFIHIIRPTGNAINVVEIKTDNNVKILRKYQFLASSKTKLYIFGIYDLQTSKINDFDDLTNEDYPKSAGIFSFELRNFLPSELKYIDFMSLDNIHGSISQGIFSKPKNIKNEKNDVTIDAKKHSSFFNINKPMVSKIEDGFIFSAEIYKPHYTTETRMEYDFYGRPYPNTYSVFSGYLFFDIIVVALSENGNLIWNNDYIVRDLKSFSLERHTQVFSDGKFVNAVYVNNGKINSKVFDGAIDVDSDETIIATNHNKDRIVQDENNHILKWYDNYFLIYGYQKINNRSLSKKNERVAFFINKIAYK
jgi:hypothetical protein